MEATHHDDVILHDSIEEAVRKSSELRPPHVAMHRSVKPRRVADGDERVPDGIEKLVAKSRTLRFVPDECLIEVRSCRGPNKQFTADELESA
jgi:hypothetical protein